MKDIKIFTVDPVRYAPHELRMRVLARDGFKCQYCGTVLQNTQANIDHVRPWLYGGRTKLKNLVTCCRDCNKAKGNKYWGRPGVLTRKIGKSKKKRNKKLIKVQPLTDKELSHSIFDAHSGARLTQTGDR